MKLQLSEFLDKFQIYDLTMPAKIKLVNNRRIDDSEYKLVCNICEIFTAIADVAKTENLLPPPGGIFWENAKKGLIPFELYLRKNRNEIDHSFLFNTRFRDFPSIAYEYDEYTPMPDFWVRRYERLVNVVSQRWHVQVPARFGEIGWNVNGYPVNRLTSINQERINAMHIAGITGYLEELLFPRILEIGAGAGELGYVLCKALPNCTWFDCDLLGSLIYSAIHLAVMLPDKQHYIYVGNLEVKGDLDEKLIIRNAEEAAQCQNAVINIPHFLLKDFVRHLKLSFAYNTYSFGEMPQTSVSDYASMLSDFLQDHGILYEQNGYFPEKGGDNVETILKNYFEQVPWPNEVDGNSFMNGAMRIWSNNTIGFELDRFIHPNKRSKIIKSFDDQGDFPDIEFPMEAWGKLEYLYE